MRTTCPNANYVQDKQFKIDIHLIYCYLVSGFEHGAFPSYFSVIFIWSRNIPWVSVDHSPPCVHIFTYLSTPRGQFGMNSSTSFIF